jgi:hypothetical protein
LIHARFRRPEAHGPVHRISASENRRQINLRQHSDWQKETRPAGNPMFAVRRDATARDEKMNMRIYVESTIMRSRRQGC